MKKLNIKSFYIFNPNLRSKKRKPTEDEIQSVKILYYYPNNEDEIIKRSNTGIIEGTICFLNEFEEKDDDFLYVELFKHIYISKKFEENFYLTFILEKSKDNQSNINYYHHNLESKKQWHKLFFDNFYHMLVLWHGSLKSIFFSENLFNDFITTNINTQQSPNNNNNNFQISNNDNNMIENNGTLNAATNYSNIITKENSSNSLTNCFTYSNNNSNKNSCNKLNYVSFPENEVLNVNTYSLKFDIRDKPEKYKQLELILNDFLIGYKENLYHNRIPFLENILYFPLTEMTYTKILLSSQRLNEKLSEMKYISVVYKGYLLHNDCPLDSFSLIYNSFFSNLDGSPKYTGFSKPNYLISQTIYNSDLDSNYINEKTKSDFRKSFENANNSFLLGIQKININNYHLFIPKIYIKSKNEYVKLVVYNFNGLIIFIYLNESFNYFFKLNMLINLEKWIKRYFDDHLNILENLYLQKLAKVDLNSFSYFNNANKSIKLSSNFYLKKSKFIDIDKLATLIKIFRYNYQNNVSAITKLKSYYVYFLNTCDRKIVILLPENLNMQSLIHNIDEIKKVLFDYIFVL